MKIVNLSTDEGLMIVPAIKKIKETWLLDVTIKKEGEYLNLSDDEMEILKTQLSEEIKNLSEKGSKAVEILEVLVKNGQKYEVDGWAYLLDTEEKLNEKVKEGEAHLNIFVMKKVEIDTVIKFSLAPMLESDYKKNSVEIDEYLENIELPEKDFNMIKVCLENNGTAGEAKIENDQYGAKYSWSLLTE